MLIDRELMNAGVQEIGFDGSHVASGTYFYHLAALFSPHLWSHLPPQDGRNRFLRRHAIRQNRFPVRPRSSARDRSALRPAGRAHYTPLTSQWIVWARRTGFSSQG